MEPLFSGCASFSPARLRSHNYLLYLQPQWQKLFWVFWDYDGAMHAKDDACQIYSLPCVPGVLSFLGANSQLVRRSARERSEQPVEERF